MILFPIFLIIILIIILQGGFMRFNQFSYLSLPRDTILYELKKYGFDFPSESTNKKDVGVFSKSFLFTYQDTNYPLSILAADKKTDLLTFFNQKMN